jgi:hypothetical protein
MQEHPSNQNHPTFSDNQWQSPDVRTASEFVDGCSSSYPRGRASRTNTCLTSSVITNNLPNIAHTSHNIGMCIGYTEFFSHGRDSHGQLGHARDKYECEEACVMSPQNLSFDILIA